jgi:hypothetical protein
MSKKSGVTNADNRQEAVLRDFPWLNKMGPEMA